MPLERDTHPLSRSSRRVASSVCAPATAERVYSALRRLVRAEGIKLKEGTGRHDIFARKA